MIGRPVPAVPRKNQAQRAKNIVASTQERQFAPFKFFVRGANPALLFAARGVPSMCDYSLHGVASRPARVGDKLLSTNFVNSFTRGFTAVDDPKVAVCLRPGTEVAFEQDVEIDHVFRRLMPRFGFGKIGQRVARFRQINMDRPDTHHDALEFPDGKVVLVTRLRAGQRATVLQLPAGAQGVHEEHVQTQDSSQASLID
jgi:hypothetical protein